MYIPILKIFFFIKNQTNQLITIYSTDEEKEIFEKKMKLANCKTISKFLRKCVSEKGYISANLSYKSGKIFVSANAHESTISSCIMREKSLRFAELLRCKVQWTLHAAKTLACCNARTLFPHYSPFLIPRHARITFP